MSDNRCSPATVHRLLLLACVMDVVDGTTECTTERRTLAPSSIRSDDDVLDTHEVAAVCEPVEEAVAEHVDEADEWDDH